MKNFENLGLNQSLLKVLPEMGINTPTEIQTKAIPILTGDSVDFVGLAQTGTGKTAAFGLPLLQKINPQSKSLQALIIVPTRELCQQVSNQFYQFSKYMQNVNVLSVYGGQSIQIQLKLLRKKPQIIIATPGRLIDLMNRNAIYVGDVSHVVLDEADEMLNMGFKEDIDKILSQTSAQKSTWLFSATMSNEIRSILSTYMQHPKEVNISPKEHVNKDIEHKFVILKGKQKTAAVKSIIDQNPDLRAVVFCRTKMDTRNLSDTLYKQGYPADALHGDLSQNQRDRVMRKFRSGQLKCLIATDVAARGIDVQNLTHVIHYALPDELAYYTHRSGRTARAGKKGTSIALISGKDTGRLNKLERSLKISFTKMKIEGELAMEDLRQAEQSNGRERNNRSFQDKRPNRHKRRNNQFGNSEQSSNQKPAHPGKTFGKRKSSDRKGNPDNFRKKRKRIKKEVTF